MAAAKTPAEKQSLFKVAATSVGGIVAILSGVWAIDSHYASAGDLQSMQRGMETQIRSVKIERLEDEVFKLDMKRQGQSGKLTTEDEALYQRYIRRLSDANKEQRASDVKPK